MHSFCCSHCDTKERHPDWDEAKRGWKKKRQDRATSRCAKEKSGAGRSLCLLPRESTTRRYRESADTVRPHSRTSWRSNREMSARSGLWSSRESRADRASPRSSSHSALLSPERRARSWSPDTSEKARSGKARLRTFQWMDWSKSSHWQARNLNRVATVRLTMRNRRNERRKSCQQGLLPTHSEVWREARFDDSAHTKSHDKSNSTSKIMSVMR